MLDIDKTLAELSEEEPIFDDSDEEESFSELIDDDFDESYALTRTGLTDEDVSELATELANVQTDDELEEWIGSLYRRVKKRVKKFAKSSVGKKLFSGLKSIAKKALPHLGRAAGGFFGGPAGAALGGKLGGFIGSRLEEEAMAEEAAMEAAEQFVRFAGEAAVRAAYVSPRLPAASAAKLALTKAGRKYPLSISGSRSGSSSGRWVRRGRNIILLGA